MIALVRKHPPGAVVPVEYRRGGASDRASVTLAAAADTGYQCEPDGTPR